MTKAALPPTAERVRLHTSQKTNDKIRDRTLSNISCYKGKDREEISKRIMQLDKEWDTERALETSASSFVMLGVALGFLFHPGWFAFVGIIGVFLLAHALEGWCPPLPLFRRLGIRTASEIDEEKAALKYLRGDFGLNTENSKEVLSKSSMS